MVIGKRQECDVTLLLLFFISVMSVLRPSLCHLRVKDLTQVPYPTRTQLKFELVGFYAESNAVIHGVSTVVIICCSPLYRGKLWNGTPQKRMFVVYKTILGQQILFFCCWNWLLVTVIIYYCFHKLQALVRTVQKIPPL